MRDDQTCVNVGMRYTVSPFDQKCTMLKTRRDPNAKEDTSLGAEGLYPSLSMQPHTWEAFSTCDGKDSWGDFFLHPHFYAQKSTAVKHLRSWVWVNTRGGTVAMLGSSEDANREQLKLNSRTEVTVEWWDLKSICGTKRCVLTVIQVRPQDLQYDGIDGINKPQN